MEDEVVLLGRRRRGLSESLGVLDEAEGDSVKSGLAPPPCVIAVPSLKGDKWNMALLFVLYLLQGIPLGLAASVPMILQNRGVSYRQQAEFSFVDWPFSLKLLWAPIVDSLFWPAFGRRKTWLVPAQYLIGLFMLYLSAHIDHWLGVTSNEAPHMGTLTALFFCLHFLAATQDIAVDGWALTMLKRENVGHASTCNTVGQTAGYFLGFVVFTALESADFCNSVLRSTQHNEGMVTLSGFLYFWGMTFLVVTTLLAVLKREDASRQATSPPINDASPTILDIRDSYCKLWQIMKLPSIQTLSVVLLTCKVGFAACDAVTSLKLVEAGVPKEKLAMMAVPLVPLQIVLPLILSKYTVGPRPMAIYIAAIPYRLLFGFVAAWFVWMTPKIIQNGIPSYYYILLLVIYCFHQVALYAMFVSVMAFFARVSDPMVGGTYMTLLNTLSNLGGNWPSTLALCLVDPLTWKSCSGAADNTCSAPDLIKACTDGGGRCETWLDGYYIETAVCALIGWAWLRWGRSRILELQSWPDSAWHVSSHPHHLHNR